VEFIVPMAGFFLEERLELADTGLPKVENVHGAVLRSFMIADSAAGARRARRE
jgi:hypothetical protein